MKRYLATAVLFATIVPAIAEPQLLVELHWEQAFVAEAQNQAILAINSRLPFTQPIFQGDLGGLRTSADVGQTSVLRPTK